MPDDREEFDIARVAGLARLALTPGEQTLYQSQLTGILAYARQVCAVAAEGVPPMSHVSGTVAVARPDRTARSLTAEEVRRNAPDARPDPLLFHVPTVLG
jgi:aspartyl-tRNA(Asn)/glutamyl-tRNA(Gln) amidotransferase subunit C